jgi:alpha-1,3-rhamnosyl/mannosyltransferase
LVAALARVAPGEKFVVLHNPALKNTRYDLGALKSYPNIKLVRVDIPTSSAREQFGLALNILQSRAAIFHSPYFIKPYLLPARSLVTIFDLIPIHYPAELFDSALRLTFRLAILLAAWTCSRILAPSAATGQDLVARLRVPRQKVSVTVLGVESRFVPQPEAEVMIAREKYSLPGKYLLYVGSNKPHKNLGTLMQAWDRTGLDAELVIAGAWDKRYAAGRSDAVTRRPIFLHNIEDADLPALYSGATTFVMPSLYEGFGLPLLEAMACGAPVISSNVSSMPDVAGDAALYFEPHDTHGLAELITRVVSDRGLQEEMRDKSLARAKGFSWERTAGETLAAYRSVAR